MGAEQQVTVVRLVGVPVDLYLRASRHRADLTREFALISFGDETGVTTNSVPARLLALVDELHNRYGRQSSGIRGQFEEAAERGQEAIEVELPASELAADMTGDKKSPDLRTLRHSQDVLGRMHDLQVLIDRVRQIQAAAGSDLRAERELEAIVDTLENDCRRLHARYVRERTALGALCARLIARLPAAAPARRPAARRAAS